jgi:hypothetical protein
MPAVEHELTLALCKTCGVVQLAPPFPFLDLVPPYDWITYREPEAHLDAVVDTICRLPGLNKRSAIAGVTFKDNTTLDRLRARGFSRAWPLDLRQDLGATDPNANIESVHGLLTPEKAAEIASRRGLVDLLIVRHIVEHAEEPWRFMQALGTLLAPNGYLVFEVPDCTANLARQDYTMVWEEHSLYFTPETVLRILAAAGCAYVGQEIHPFPFEDVIVTYARKSSTGDAAHAMPAPAMAERNVALAQAFGQSFATWTQRYHRLFEELTRDGRRLAAYGAGHLTGAFLNFHAVADYFAFVVDDSPHKQGLLLPKCRLPIMPSSRLTANEVSACLFGLAPELENRIIARNSDYIAAGGKFYSMFVDSERSIRKLVDDED